MQETVESLNDPESALESLQQYIPLLLNKRVPIFKAATSTLFTPGIPIVSALESSNPRRPCLT